MNVVSAAFMAFDIQQFAGLDTKWLIVIFFLLSLALLLWAIADLHHRLEEILTSRPNIVLKQVDEHYEGHMETRVRSSPNEQWVTTKSESPRFTRIWVANEPTRVELGIKAEDLAGQIEVWDESCSQPRFSMAGRWAETRQVVQGADILETKQITIPPNASPFCMDIGIKYLDEDDFYGYNDETQRKGAPGGRDHERVLGKGTHTVGVRFRCKGVDTTFWFKLHNEGKGSDVRFEPITPPKSDRADSQT